MAWTDQIFVTVLMLVAFLVFWRLLRHRDVDERLTKFWTSLPSVGLRGGGWFSWTWAVLRSITKSAGNAAEGYHRFSKHGLCFVLPSTGTGAIVVLPPSQLHLLNRSENQVAAFQAQLESIQPHYMIGDKNLYENTIEFDIVRKQLTRDVGYFAAMTVEELDAAFKECWGTSKEWTTIGAWDTCAKIIARAANRAFVGLPLCRDETFLEQSRLYAIAVYGGASVIAALPKVVRPVVGPLVALAAKRYLAACKRDLVPYVEERLRQVGKNWEDAPVCTFAYAWFLSYFKSANHI